MKAQVTNFPTNRALFIKKPFYTPSFELINTAVEDNLPAFHIHEEFQNFERILSSKELAKDMFPPDYFILVE